MQERRTTLASILPPHVRHLPTRAVQASVGPVPSTQGPSGVAGWFSRCFVPSPRAAVRAHHRLRRLAREPLFAAPEAGHFLYRCNHAPNIGAAWIKVNRLLVKLGGITLVAHVDAELGPGCIITLMNATIYHSKIVEEPRHERGKCYDPGHAGWCQGHSWIHPTTLAKGRMAPGFYFFASTATQVATPRRTVAPGSEYPSP